MHLYVSSVFLFTFNKWAFANYHFTLLSLAALAAASPTSEQALRPLWRDRA